MALRTVEVKKNILSIIFDFARNQSDYVSKYALSNVQMVELANVKNELDKLIASLDYPGSIGVRPRIGEADYPKLKRVLELSFIYGSDLNAVSMETGLRLSDCNKLLHSGVDFLYDNIKGKDFSFIDREPLKNFEEDFKPEPKPKPRPRPAQAQAKPKKKPSFMAKLLFLVILFAGGITIYNAVFNKSATRVTSLIQEYRSDKKLANRALSKGSSAIKIYGSSSVLKPVQSWKDQFLSIHQDLSLDIEIGDSAFAINKLLDGSVNIAATSRIPTVEERKRSQKLNALLADHKVAMDAVAVFVNPANPVNELSIDDLKEIFTSESANWDKYGGYFMDVKRYSQTPESGTFQFFKDRVLGMEPFSTSVVKLYDTNQLIDLVEKDESAIGFASLSNILNSGVKVLGISTFIKDKAVSPYNESNWVDVQAIKHGEYPLTRYLYLVTSGDIDEASAKFIDYFRSEQGQRVLGANGLVSIY